MRHPCTDKLHAVDQRASSLKIKSILTQALSRLDIRFWRELTSDIFWEACQ
jgi:hypothetical protein